MVSGEKGFSLSGIFWLLFCCKKYDTKNERRRMPCKSLKYFTLKKLTPPLIYIYIYVILIMEFFLVSVVDSVHGIIRGPIKSRRLPLLFGLSNNLLPPNFLYIFRIPNRGYVCVWIIHELASVCLVVIIVKWYYHNCTLFDHTLDDTISELF